MYIHYKFIQRFIASFVALALFSVSFTVIADAVNDDKHLSAEMLVKWVLESNPGLDELEAAIDAAAARVTPAGSLDDPQLSFSIAPETFDGFSQDDGRILGFNQHIELSQSIPWPGTLALREERAKSGISIADQQLIERRLHIISTIKSGFAEWYYVHRALQINEQNQQLLLELQHVAEAQYAAGRAAQQDALQAEVKVNVLRDQALKFRREKRSIQAQLNALLNRKPHEPLQPPGDLPSISPLPDSEKLHSLAVNSHPALKQLEASLDAREVDVALAEKKYFPDFKIQAGYNSLWDEEDKRFQIGASINLPLDQSKRSAAVSAAKAEKMKIRWQLVDRRNQLLADLERAYAEVIESQDAITLYKDRLLPLAEENLAAAEADYRAGAGDFLNVITAENQKLETELRLERARANYIRRLAELERWTGGSFSANDPNALRN